MAMPSFLLLHYGILSYWRNEEMTATNEFPVTKKSLRFRENELKKIYKFIRTLNY